MRITAQSCSLFATLVVVVVVLTRAYTGYVEPEVSVTARAGEAPTPRWHRVHARNNLTAKGSRSVSLSELLFQTARKVAVFLFFILPTKMKITIPLWTVYEQLSVFMKYKLLFTDAVQEKKKFSVNKQV